MRKLLSMAVVMMMIALATTGCKNDTNNDPENPTDTGKKEITDNPLFNAFKMCQNFVGQDKSAIGSTLTNNGFTVVDASNGIYMKYGDSYWMQTSFKLKDNTVYDFSINVSPYKTEGKTYSPVLTGDYVIDAVNKIGEKFQMSGTGLRFWRTYDNMTQQRAETFSAFPSVVNDNRLHDTKTIWLAESINHYDAKDLTNFIGMTMAAQRDENNYGGVQEYKITFIYTNNTLNK